MRVRCCLLVLVVFLAAGAPATTITFTNDTTGAKANGWSSVDSPLVAFSDSMGANLTVMDFLHQSFGNGLSVSDDDQSYLIMDFAVPMDSLSLWFGNDDPDNSSPGDQAVLTLFQGSTQVSQFMVTMNRDDMMNQMLGISGVVFDRATFFYAVHVGLSEVVDNIEFHEYQAPVPEPASLTLLASGVGALGMRLRKRIR